MCRVVDVYLFQRDSQLLELGMVSPLQIASLMRRKAWEITLIYPVVNIASSPCPQCLFSILVAPWIYSWPGRETGGKVPPLIHNSFFYCELLCIARVLLFYLVFGYTGSLLRHLGYLFWGRWDLINSSHQGLNLCPLWQGWLNHWITREAPWVLYFKSHPFSFLGLFQSRAAF